MKLYGYRNGRTLRAAWALEEAGVQYDYVQIDLMRGEGRGPKFLEINPAGKVPVLTTAEQSSLSPPQFACTWLTSIPRAS